MDRFEAVIALVSIIAGTGTVVAVTAVVANTVLKLRKTPQIDFVGLQQVEARLERMEQAIDAMAVEMERISEGQRFTPRLLSEKAEVVAPLPVREKADARSAS
ncbi:MAG: hypothetical protein JNJ98_18710 [Gemmatimonadetes bacterium]|nr:hypothetical protein [Gemmatimonadota bacterium]